jgi:hypothetical protein
MKRSRNRLYLGSFHQHGTAAMSGTSSRLAYPRVQAKVAHEFPGALEPTDISDRGQI